MAVAVQIHELEIGVAQIAVQTRSERAEGLPALGLVVFVEAGGRAFHHDHIGLAVTGQVHEVGAAAQGDVGLEGDGFERGELRLVVQRTQVALVEPGAGLLGEDAGDAFAVQIGPAVRAAVQANG
jgi:hypothetical protein